MTSEGTEVTPSGEPRSMPYVDQNEVMKMLARQGYRIRIARYCMHKVRNKVYSDAVRRGELDYVTAAELYRQAMENFDQLMGTDMPNWGATIEAEMAKGFDLNG